MDDRDLDIDLDILDTAGMAAQHRRQLSLQLAGDNTSDRDIRRDSLPHG
jgi:hypothetical protein